jgi:hypothetical protein
LFKQAMQVPGVVVLCGGGGKTTKQAMQVPGVVVLCGGGGKTTLARSHPELFADIDDFWDPTRQEETLLLSRWAECSSAGDVAQMAELARAAVLLKARNCLRCGSCGRVVLVQTPEQAHVILQPADDVDARILVLYPTVALHEEALLAKAESDWARRVCREQRATCEASEGATEFSSYEWRTERILAFAASILRNE